ADLSSNAPAPIVASSSTPGATANAKLANLLNVPQQFNSCSTAELRYIRDEIKIGDMLKVAPLAGLLIVLLEPQPATESVKYFAAHEGAEVVEAVGAVDAIIRNRIRFHIDFLRKDGCGGKSLQGKEATFWDQMYGLFL